MTGPKALAQTGPGLIRVTDLWHWRLALSPEGQVPAAWTSPEFDDTAWNAAPSGFAGDISGGESTLLSSTPLPSPGCFRRTFEIDDPQTVAWLVLRIDWTGGFVAYLNGIEIARRNLPVPEGQPVPLDTLPLPRSKGAAEEVDCSAAIGQLRPGTNLLAVQWHPVPGTYGSGLVPELLANFTRGPFVQSTTPTSQTIVWRTATPATSVVEFGETAQLGRSVEDTNTVLQHVVTLLDLRPDTTCFYRVRSADGTREGVSPLLAFRTFRETGPVEFVVAADVGGGGLRQAAVGAAMRNANPDLVLMAGDVVYPSYKDALADQRFFSMYHAQMTGTPFYVVAGNHEYWSAQFASLHEAFVLPRNSVAPELHAAAVTGPESYYSFDHGDAHFAGLQVPLYDRGLELAPGTAQFEWLANDLARSAKPWKFIFLHLPLMSSGPHADDDYNLNGWRDSQELADVLLPLARRHGVQMIFSGHDHAYERFRPVQGVHCIVTGGGGGSLYPMAERHPANAQFLYRWQCVQVSVNGDTLRLRALGESGEVLDAMFVERLPPKPSPRTTVWHEPEAAFTGPSDGDGNRIGQRYDFPGDSLPTAPGDFSNLGRVHVARDHGFLHLGFHGVMLPRDGNLVLFLESPTLPGIPTMRGLGNGLVDPLGQGVDGLDFLENLDFREFRPALACLLGDEFADGQYRSFTRTNITVSWMGIPVVMTNLDLNIGQGAFWLDPGFSDVPGARIEQFNRSPQDEAATGEQNADYILVSLPLAELGLRDGDVFRLAAVATGAAFDLASQTRFMDRSFLGAELEGSGLSPAVLRGLDITLSPDLDRDGDRLLSAEEETRRTNPEDPDTDRDGLPDGWEVRHHFDPLSPLGRDGDQGDPDGDGFTNAAEWAAGTDPQDPASALRVTLRRRVDGSLEFRWRAVLTKPYQIEAADSLEGPYVIVSPEGEPRTASTAEEVRVLQAPVHPRREQWYRVALAVSVVTP